MSSRYILVWFAMLIIAFANGTLREVLLVRWLEPTTARQVSTMILLIVFGIVIFAAARRWPFRSRMHALAVGLIWAAATVLFEAFSGASPDRAGHKFVRPTTYRPAISGL